VIEKQILSFVTSSKDSKVLKYSKSVNHIENDLKLFCDSIAYGCDRNCETNLVWNQK
jgi:hypothetical protein